MVRFKNKLDAADFLTIRAFPTSINNVHAALPSPESDSLTFSDDWHTGKEKSYADEVKAQTLLGTLECKSIDPSGVGENGIYQVLQSHKVTNIKSMYQISKDRLILIFGSCESALECQKHELLGTSESGVSISLLFQRKRRTLIFITLCLPGYISC